MAPAWGCRGRRCGQIDRPQGRWPRNEKPASGRENGFPFDHIAFAPGAPCDIDQAHFAKADGQPVDLTVTAADRLMRFERLRRRAGVGTDQLARALSNYGGAGIDAGFVTRLAAMLEVAIRIKASLDDLLDWTALPPADQDAALTLFCASASSADRRWRHISTAGPD